MASASQTANQAHAKDAHAGTGAKSSRFLAASLLRWTMLTAAAILFGLHFLHLNADFPNHSPWMDWAKYTDEGWYGDAAIRHYLTGHWYWKGDFNPAVALPVWPVVEWVVFRFTGVSAAAARALTLCVFALALCTFYRLIERHAQPYAGNPGPSLAAPIAMLFLCASPYFYVFQRMAILEPLLIALTALALLAASHLHPLRFKFATLLPAIALGLLLPAMVLTKTTAIFLVPAVAYMVWTRAGYSFRAALRLSILPALMAAGLWLAYIVLIVRPHYLADYKYLFSANAYTGIELAPFATVILNTIADGMWMGHMLYPVFFAVLALLLFWRPELFRNPLVPSLLLWAGGYFAFLAYHNNLQPRYYLVVAAPITVLVALGIDCFRQSDSHRARVIASALAALTVVGIVVPDMLLQLHFIMYPEYSFEAAAKGIRSIVLADATHPHLVLSISGSDLSLMTGLPSIDDDFGTLDLDQRVKQYRPGWYAAWNELDDDKMDALTPLYHIERVAAFPAMDDPDRNLLILYRLDPTIQTALARTHRRRTPKPLITKMGQQPSISQLQH